MSRKLLEQNGICPVATTIDLLSSKWKVLIIRDLLPGTKRFSELKISVGGSFYLDENPDKRKALLEQ